MSIKITLKNKINEKLVKNYVLFCDENFKINGLDKLSISNQSNSINKSINSNFIKNKDFLLFNLNPIQKIILIKIKKNQSSLESEKIGAKFFNFIKSNSIFNLNLFDKNIKNITPNNEYFLDDFIHGVQLKSYNFNKYKSDKKKRFF